MSDFKSAKKNSTITSIDEGKEYETSIDFEDDVSKLEEILKSAMALINKPEWADWMEQTDTNFGTHQGSADDLNGKLYDAIEKAQEALDTLYNHMVSVSE